MLKMFERKGAFVVVFFLATLSLFARQTLFGVDSYGWKSYVCSGWGETFFASNPLAILFFDLMPCSMLFFKALMFGSLVLSLWFLFKIVWDNYGERIAWSSILFLLALSPMVLFEFGKFENELLAYPIIIFGIYCFLNKKWFEGVVSFIASLVFWGWPYYLTTFGGPVLEQQYFSGMLLLFGLIFCVPMIFLSKRKDILVGGLVSIGLFLLNMKFFVFLLPFLVFGIAEAVKLLDKRLLLHKYAFLIAFFLLICWNLAFFIATPSVWEQQIVVDSVEMQKDLNIPIYNDWSYGYWLIDNGFETENHPGQNQDYNYSELEKPFLALTKEDLSTQGCELINSSSSFTRSVNLWKCE